MPARKLDSDLPCGCGHPHGAHEHYRKGTDCALCDCPRFTLGRAAASATPSRISRILRRPRNAVA
jgi:hypothetical protein